MIRIHQNVRGLHQQINALKAIEQVKRKFPENPLVAVRIDNVVFAVKKVGVGYSVRVND